MQEAQKRAQTLNGHRPRRIMIILWSWKHGGLTEAYDEWTLNSKKYAGDKVIRVDASWSPSTKALIQDLVHQYIETGQVYLFLHRSHGYNYKVVDQILSNLRSLPNASQQLRCFLFGEGHDYIYIAKQARGLLGTRGTFSARMPIKNGGTKATQLITAVADSQKKVLKKEHFDNVWRFYTNTFKAKIFELKEDLFAYLLALHHDERTQQLSVYQDMKKQ